MCGGVTPMSTTGPGVAAVAAVQQHAAIALEIAAGRHEQLARIARHLADVTAIDLALGVQRLQLHVPPMVAAVGAAEHAGPADAEHRAGPPAAGQHAVHIDRVIVEILAVAQVFPMLAAVGGADGAADLDGGVQVVRLADAGIQHQHPLCRVGARSPW